MTGATRTVRVVAGPDAIRHVRGMVSGRSRWPHHTTSTASMLGRVTADEGGTLNVALGECVLASGATLVLSDLPEWRRETVEAIGHVWRSGYVTHGREVPVRIRAEFDIVATRELCPCGMRGREDARCGCTAGMLDRWEARHLELVRLLEGGGQ